MSRIFKDLLASDHLIRVFCTGRLIHPVAIELFALGGGYQGFWIDQEHAGVTTQQISMAATAGRACSLASFVRMPVTNYAAVTQALESGVEGVMAAQVNTAAEAEQFVRWAKFAPRGCRGLNTQGADGHYTNRSATELAEVANRDGFVAIQIETLGAILEECEQIAAIKDVDLLFVGPADLSQAMGLLGRPNDERVWAAIERVAAAVRKVGKHWGIVPFDPPCANRCVELGCRMLTFGSDVMALRLGVAAVKNMYASQFSRGGE